MKGILFRMDVWEAKQKVLEQYGEAQTRRLIKPQPSDGLIITDIILDGFPLWVLANEDGEQLDGKYPQPRYQVGEFVYRKEAWATIKENDNLTPNELSENSAIFYKFGENRLGDDPDELKMERGKWRSPLFMPEWAARDFLQITAVRAERLQEIAGEDCAKEGIIFPHRIYGDGDDEYFAGIEKDYIRLYAELWDSINKENQWASNPWVWVYTFKAVPKP